MSHCAGIKVINEVILLTALARAASFWKSGRGKLAGEQLRRWRKLGFHSALINAFKRLNASTKLTAPKNLH